MSSKDTPKSGDQEQPRTGRIPDGVLFAGVPQEAEAVRQSLIVKALQGAGPATGDPTVSGSASSEAEEEGDGGDEHEE